MTQYIQIGGANRPVRFGWAGLLEYEQQTGRKALADFAEFSGGAASISVTTLVDMVYYGLVCGHRKAGVNVDFDKFDVADWIGGDSDVMNLVMKVFTDSFPADTGNAKPGKPKQAAPA
jgi:hypothetical protein